MVDTDLRDRFLKTALIVGGGQGIGLGFVRQLLAADKIDRVYATYRRVNSAAELLAISDS
jgi:NAD(P)-dependent dehydrogenase (short-subunit alcohol dehydrogenase family)